MTEVRACECGHPQADHDRQGRGCRLCACKVVAFRRVVATGAPPVGVVLSEFEVSGEQETLVGRMVVPFVDLRGVAEVIQATMVDAEKSGVLSTAGQ